MQIGKMKMGINKKIGTKKMQMNKTQIAKVVQTSKRKIGKRNIQVFLTPNHKPSECMTYTDWLFKEKQNR